MFFPFLVITAIAVFMSTSGIANPSTAFRIRTQTPGATRAPSPNKLTSNVLTLTRKMGNPASQPYLKTMRMGRPVGGVYQRFQSAVDPLEAVAGSSIFLAQVSFGDQMFDAVVDTGSSDTWIAQTGFDCINPATNALQSESYCAFGPTYNISTTFAQLPNVNFNTSYVDGELLNGILGTETVILAGIVVPNQVVGIVDYAAWYGDGSSSGLIGLAYPVLTHAFPGSDPQADVEGTQGVYSPVMTSMSQEGLINPMFSLAISRGVSDGGLLAIGGLPSVRHSSYFASIAIEVLTMHPINGSNTTGAAEYQFYTIRIGGYAYSNDTSTQFVSGQVPNGPSNPKKRPMKGADTQVIVDSGTTLIYVPEAIADACNATAPVFGVNISGKIFYINPSDMVLDTGDGKCITGVQGNGGGLNILGDVFLKNVLAVFDIGASEMRFAAREYY
ncbi:aspartic peptidase domain-containing protein [Cryomyces antarcticus]